MKILSRIKSLFVNPKQEEKPKPNEPRLKLLTLRREYYDTHTYGVIEELINMHTLELPNRDNQPRISCIPEGLYFCKNFNGTRFKDVWKLENVKNRTAILIHAGNTADDIQGCILVGSRRGSIGDLPAVLSSKVALERLKQYIGRDEFGRLNSFMLNIVS